jgi:hypothetical protein
MKKLLIGLLAIGSIATYAHPENGDSIYRVGKGAKIKVLKNINLKPKNHSARMNDWDPSSSKTRYCVVNPREVKNHDRAFAKGSEYTIQDVSLERLYGMRSNYIQATITTDNKDFTLKCIMENKNDIKIKDFKKINKGYLKLKLAAPERL